MIELLAMSSPNVVKIVLMLEEVGAAYTLTHTDVFAGEQHTAAFRAKSPNGKVPVLIDDDGTAVSESAAILLYLARKFGRFLPEDGNARRIAEQWLMIQTASIGPMFGQYVHFFRYAPPGQDYGVRRYASEAARLCEVLEAHLAQSPYVAGEEYGLADMAVWPWIRTADQLFPLFTEQGIWARLPALRAWFDKVAERPATKAAIESIGRLGPSDMAAFQRADADAIDRFTGRGKWDRAAVA